MQDGVGGLIHRLPAHLPRGGTEQGEQLGGAAPHILMGLARGVTSGLPGLPWVRDGLVGTGFIFAPHLQAQRLSAPIGPCDEFLFGGGVRILDSLHAVLALAQGHPRLTPGATALPGVAGVVQDLENGEGADVRQSIGSTAQSALQGRERPRRRPILLAVRYPAELPHDTLPVGRGIGGAPSSTGLVIEGRQAQPVETADERGYGVPHPPPDGGSRGSQGAARGDRQQGLTTTRVTGETVRATLARLGVRWLRAKTWITSPDPAYERKKGGATA